MTPLVGDISFCGSKQTSANIREIFTCKESQFLAPFNSTFPTAEFRSRSTRFHPSFFSQHQQLLYLPSSFNYSFLVFSILDDYFFPHSLLLLLSLSFLHIGTYLLSMHNSSFTCNFFLSFIVCSSFHLIFVSIVTIIVS